MNSRPIFNNISPIDHRYSVSEREVFDALVPWLSEGAQVASCVSAEIALVMAHLASRGKLGTAIRAAVVRSGTAISPDEVYAEEEQTHHAVRALVNVLKTRLAEVRLDDGTPVAPLVHLGATSADILDTSLAWRIKGAIREVALPQLRRLLGLLCDAAEREAETPQVGRTHGQHAVPITAGFALAEYAARLGKSLAEIEKRALDLRGKLSGAVGAYNALSLIDDDPEALEKRYLAELDLLPSEYSTQLVEPEYLLRLLLELNVAFGIIANLADDLRNLQRSEIAEFHEGFDATQVGSSTMPQKRNPWNSEHVKSLWKAFAPRVMTFFMDQISEHQRDLTNSASQRFTADYITGFCFAVRRMSDVIAGLGVNRERMLLNLRAASVMAEPAYILLAESGVSDAHEVIRRITLAAEKEGLDFAAALFRDTEVSGRIAAQLLKRGLIEKAEDAVLFFRQNERYCGLAAKKARAIAAAYRA
jgi:adenylosuccinate lyase